MVHLVSKYNVLQILIGMQLSEFVLDKLKIVLPEHILMGICVLQIQIIAHLEHFGTGNIVSQIQLSVQLELFGMEYLANYSKASALTI